MNKTVRFQIHKIALSAVFVVLAVIAGRLSFYIPIGGFPSMRFSLTALPIIIGSFLLGPLYGGIIGGLGDLIGALLFPFGAYFFGFTLDGILLGIIPGLIMLLSKKFHYAPILVMSFLFVLIGGLLTYFFSNYPSITVAETTIELTATIKTLILILYLVLFGSGIAAIYFSAKQKKNTILINALTAVIANEVLVSVLLASLWKEMLYSLPYFLNVGIALIYMLVNVPIKTIIISLIYPTVVQMVNVQNIGIALSKNDHIN